MNIEQRPPDARTAEQLGVLSFILNRVIVQQRLLAAVIAKVEGKEEQEVLARMEQMLKQTEGETIFYLKKYWLGQDPAPNGQEKK